ncbi:UbiA family prenyltransferase [Nereida sp. MMG025]|uniref:UbiA family prenyltransferase n=1 Tax=Nereida sp. MMG025 TaxID=2909981 RepID=UPI00351CD16D|nr:UbiA family prenyltransferase [Nereida sp. MMG025]
MSDLKPLVLDVDGTFLKTDMLFECFWAGLGRDPIAVLKTSAQNFRHPAVLKAELAKIAEIRADLLPVQPEIKALAQESLAAGREVVLASASHETQVRALAKAHGLSERVFASDGATNLKGVRKADALVEAYGENGFDYAGNEATDIPIWQVSENALMVDGSDALAQTVAQSGKTVSRYGDGWSIRDAIRAMRPHQWVKNVLLFLPMIAAHDFGWMAILLTLLGMAAFSAAASCIYIVNDLLDLEADRLHKTKHKRPFASGAVPIKIGMMLCLLLGVIALGLGALLSPAFFGVIVIYMTLSLAYSLRLKRMRWIDVAVLATLYTLRVVAGAAASGVDASGYMLVFIFPVFITLGCVKRMTELAKAENDDRLPGRGYGKPDRGDLLNVSAIGMVGALLIFFLYSFSEQALALYPSQWLLWLALVPIAIWLYRMIKTGWLGAMDYDPIVFALRDKMGVGIILIVIGMMFYAAGLFQQWFGF